MGASLRTSVALLIVGTFARQEIQKTHIAELRMDSRISVAL